jgi:hypothetical protein
MNVGAAEIDITPDFGVELSGFAAREQPASGVLDSLFARAVYLQQGDEKLIWVACDVVALPADLVDAVRSWATERLGLEPRQVLLCATHTHNAPATIALNAAGKQSERYVRFLRFHIESVMQEAMRKTRPCRIVSGSVGCTMGADRRKTASAHVDSNLWTLAFLAKSGDYVAAIVNYPMHPVALGHVERRIAPDWCGAAAATVSKSLAGHPITLITNGAAGNINPPALNAPPEKVRRMGDVIGRFALRCLGDKEPAVDATLAVKSIRVALPLEALDDEGIDRAAEAFFGRSPPDDQWAALRAGVAATWSEAMKRAIRSGGGGGRSVPIEIQAARIGDVRVVAVNGELFSRFTEMLRKRTTANLFVVGYANAAFGYIPAKQAYAEGGYEVDEAHFFYNSFRPAEGGLELLVDRAAELIDSL